MTYCLAIKSNHGLVFCSDSRTNAGPDRLSSYSKMKAWGVDGYRQFILLSAGSLATTQAVVARINKDIAEQSERSLFSVRYLWQAADYIGELGLQEKERRTEALDDSVNYDTTFIFGGQIAGEPPDLFLIYPQGNHIKASSLAPYFQSGETKYGKPILDRIVRLDTSLDDAVKCALISMDSTINSNATVGPPIELRVYETDALRLGSYASLHENHPYLETLQEAWQEKLSNAFAELPQLGDESWGYKAPLNVGE
jgi:putative proteasome-type protease